MRAVVRRALYASALLVFVFGGPGCRSAHHERETFRRAALKDLMDEIDELKKGGAKDVLTIPVFWDGTVLNKDIKMRADYHAIVWFTVGPEELTVLPTSYEPRLRDFPRNIKCHFRKGICSTPHFKPKETEFAVFGYSGFIGKEPGTKLDPRIEIVN